MSEDPKRTKDDAARIQAKIQADATEKAAKYQANAQIVQAIAGALALILVAVIGLNKSSNSSVQPSQTPTFTSAPTETPASASTSTPVILPTTTFSPTPYVCPYAGNTDNETIINLIKAEADYSAREDMSGILSIFDPNAIFYDFSSTPVNQWLGPIARYRDDLFKTTDLKEVEHFDISSVGPGIVGDTAYYTSGSRGYYRIGNGDWNAMFNGSLYSTPPTKFGSEHWILKKNSYGCWVITQMEFNAGHVEFP